MSLTNRIRDYNLTKQEIPESLLETYVLMYVLYPLDEDKQFRISSLVKNTAGNFVLNSLEENKKNILNNPEYKKYLDEYEFFKKQEDIASYNLFKYKEGDTKFGNDNIIINIIQEYDTRKQSNIRGLYLMIEKNVLKELLRTYSLGKFIIDNKYDELISDEKKQKILDFYKIINEYKDYFEAQKLIDPNFNPKRITHREVIDSYRLNQILKEINSSKKAS